MANENDYEVEGEEVAPGWEAPPEPPMPSFMDPQQKWISHDAMRSAEDMIRGALDQQGPDRGGAGLEKILQDYPTISRDFAAALVMSGQGRNIPEPLLASLAEEDAKAQSAASDAGWYGALKTGSRGLFIVAEDLWNLSPGYVIGRTAINRYQGKTWGEALEAGTQSQIGNQINLNQAGLKVNYGSGFLPSDELVPMGAGFWEAVQESIYRGEFEGSAEEQIIAAEQKAMIANAKAMGFSPYALAREQWTSTMLTKTVNGEEYSVPFSYGTGAAYWFTTPGSRANGLMSGLIDSSLRMTVEPLDVPMDFVGDVVRAPKVVGDMFSLQSDGTGNATLREVLRLNGTDMVDVPILARIQRTGKEVEVLGVTGNKIDDVTGAREILVDAAQHKAGWNEIMSDWAEGSTRSWDADDLVNPYLQPFIDAGLEPTDVRREIQAKGSEEAYIWLTIEHEIVHNTLQTEWFGRQVWNGNTYVDQNVITKKAPKELTERLKSEKLTTLEEIEDVGNQRAAFQEAAHDLSNKADGIELRLREGVEGPKVRATMNDEVVKLRKEIKDLLDDIKHTEDVQEEMYLGNKSYQDAVSEVLEYHATKVSWERMMDNSWTAPAMLKKAKQHHGLSSRLRPYAVPKSMREWLLTTGGKNALRDTAKMTDVEALRKKFKYLHKDDIRTLSLTSDEGTIAQVLIDAFEGTGKSKVIGSHRPTGGRVSALAHKGMDGWTGRVDFLGGHVSRASVRMGRQVRRSKASTGANVLSMTDHDGTLDAINSILATNYVDKKTITYVQNKYIEIGETMDGLDQIYDDIRKYSSESLKERSGNLYTQEQVEFMWDEWTRAEIRNRKYWVSNAGHERKLLWDNGKFRGITTADDVELASQAAMEAQFAVTNRVLPKIRDFRRLNSHRRGAYERIRKLKDSGSPVLNDMSWDPLGFGESRGMMAADLTFGVWRDWQLMRGGWAMRVLPEEQIRFSASGYSGLFKNPLDYFISMFSEMDYKLIGDDVTLAQIMRMQETLGTADLRNTQLPTHVVSMDDWDVVNQYDHAVLFWGGLTREFIQSNADELTSSIALEGRESVLRALIVQVPEGGEELVGMARFTPEGQEFVKRISRTAHKASPLEGITDPAQLAKWVDTLELRIAQITGGDGIWFDTVTNAWLDQLDNVQLRPQSFDAMEGPGGLKEAVTRMDSEALKGKSKITRKDLEALYNELKGFDLDALDKEGRAAFVTKAGNEDLVGLLANGTLDDIALSPEMPYKEIRAIDAQLQAAFESRGAVAPRNWAVAKGEVKRMGGEGLMSTYNNVTDQAFLWLNGIPSKVLNRQPFFQQAFGRRLAEAYYFGDSSLRASIDEFAAINPAFQTTMDLGRTHVFREYGVSSYPKPFEPSTIKVDNLDDLVPRNLLDDNLSDVDGIPFSSFEDDVERGLYNVIPFRSGEGHVTNKFFELIEDGGGQRLETYRPQSTFEAQAAPLGGGTEARRAPGTGIHGTDKYTPTGETPTQIDEFNALQDRVLAAEKVSDPIDWTPEERAAYDAGDYEKFSRLRGYSDEEIADYQKYQGYLEGSDPNKVQNPDGSVDAQALFANEDFSDMQRMIDAQPTKSLTPEQTAELDELMSRHSQMRMRLAEAEAMGAGSDEDYYRLAQLESEITDMGGVIAEPSGIVDLEYEAFLRQQGIDEIGGELGSQFPQWEGGGLTSSIDRGLIYARKANGYEGYGDEAVVILFDTETFSPELKALFDERDIEQAMSRKMLEEKNFPEWNTLVIEEGLQPIAVIPAELFHGMTNYGFVAKTNRAIGDAALTIDNTLDVYMGGVRQNVDDIKRSMATRPENMEYRLKEGVQDLDLNFDDVPQAERNASVERIFGPTHGQNYKFLETGGPSVLPNSSADDIDQLEWMMQSAKASAIDETKALFYDLTNKSNVADAMKFIFPFGDAWYEVLSRWAKIMNPVENGGQVYRNVRRTQNFMNAGQLSGFISTNDYGEEVFNIPIAAGNLTNAFLPDTTGVSMKASMPISSMMFIDPSARGVLLPSVGPTVQIATQFLAPRSDVPLFSDALDWLTYGDKENYRPGDIDAFTDVATGVLPTVFRRLVANVFDEEHRAQLGTTKYRIFQSIGMSGDPTYNMATPDGARKAWDLADKTGSWLGWFRMFDSFFMPGQPQYAPVFDNTIDSRYKADDANSEYYKLLLEGSKLDAGKQNQIVSVLRASEEYRLARETFGDAEADMYMIERYGVLPSFLQSASAGIVEYPVTWGGTEWIDSNDYLLDIAPLTLSGTVPEDADDTFNSAAFNRLYGHFLLVDGVENQPIRRKRSPSELQQAVVRGLGYDQLRFQGALHERAVEQLRSKYGEKYASNEGYRAQKLTLDQKLARNRQSIISEYPIVSGGRQGEIIGSQNGALTRAYVDEVIRLGTPGSKEHKIFSKELPELAIVAETYAGLFNELEAISRLQDRGKASQEWWNTGESDKAEALRKAVAQGVEAYYKSLEGDARAYAQYLNDKLMDPLLKEWEWIDRRFAPEMESFPSIANSPIIEVGGSGG